MCNIHQLKGAGQKQKRQQQKQKQSESLARLIRTNDMRWLHAEST